MMYEYGIKYKVIKLSKTQYILFPISLEKIPIDSYDFNKEDQQYNYLYDKSDLKNRYVIDKAFSKDELEYIYEYAGDEEFLSQYYFEDYKDILIYITIEQDDVLNKSEIDLKRFQEKDIDLAFFMDKNIPAIILNDDALNQLLNSNDIREIKVLLEKYKKLVNSFPEYNKKGITKINVENGKVKSLETSRKITGENIETQTDIHREQDSKIGYPNIIKKSNLQINPEITYQGLRDAIKEKVFGHDEEIDTFAQKLYMNYTAEDNEPVESILLVGPTGTGKTETVKAACEYLDIPSFSANAANIVPQGIKGMSIEDIIVGLFERADYDENKAQRGLIFLDEFDKLNESDIDIKSTVKNILLTFTAGGTFPIDNDRYTFQFDSSMTNKVYAGVFQKISEKEKSIGFAETSNTGKVLGTDQEMREKIIAKGYFTLEELSRISTILGYEDLDRETKRNILLYSKISEFAKKRERYKRQFGVDLIAEDSYLEAILDSISNSATGMRSLNNFVKRTIDSAERYLLEHEKDTYKKLVLTKDTVEDHTKFDLL